MTAFSDELLSAIGDWQRGWSEDQDLRLKKAAALVTHSARLDIKFRSAKALCYRKRFIHSNELSLFFTDSLVEGPASWTFDPTFAEQFKGTIREGAIMGAIFHRFPSYDEIVVNISALWEDADFRDAVADYARRGGDNANALQNFQGKQKEIVLRSKLLPADIYAISGRGDFEALCADAGIISESQKDEVWKILIDTNLQPEEPCWIDQAGALKVFDRALTNFKAFLDKHKL